MARPRGYSPAVVALREAQENATFPALRLLDESRQLLRQLTLSTQTDRLIAGKIDRNLAGSADRLRRLNGSWREGDAEGEIRRAA